MLLLWPVLLRQLLMRPWRRQMLLQQLLLPLKVRQAGRLLLQLLRVPGYLRYPCRARLQLLPGSHPRTRLHAQHRGGPATITAAAAAVHLPLRKAAQPAAAAAVQLALLKAAQPAAAAGAGVGAQPAAAAAAGYGVGDLLQRLSQLRCGLQRCRCPHAWVGLRWWTGRGEGGGLLWCVCGGGG